MPLILIGLGGIAGASVGDGLITLERVEVTAYRGSLRDGEHPVNEPSTSG